MATFFSDEDIAKIEAAKCIVTAISQQLAARKEMCTSINLHELEKEAYEAALKLLLKVMK